VQTVPKQSRPHDEVTSRPPADARQLTRPETGSTAAVAAALNPAGKVAARIMWTAAVAAALTGCLQTVVAHAPSGSDAVTRESEWAHFFLFGFIGKKSIDLRDHCGARQVGAVEQSGDAITISVSILTVGIYVPRRLTITCNEPRSP
jgi:hypothetical protein